MKHLSSWFRKSFFAVLDQALFAGGNFILIIILARWLTPVQYGAFTIAYSLLILIGSVQTAIIIEPMMVFGASYYEARFNKYLGNIIYLHVGVMFVLGLIIIAFSMLMGKYYYALTSNLLIILAITAPLILLFWILRHAFYVRFQSLFSAISSGINLILVVTLMYLFLRFEMLTGETAFIIMGLTALVVSLCIIVYFKPNILEPKKINLLQVLRKHFRYGRWALGTAGLIWLPGNIYFLIMPMSLGLEGTAALRAIMNLILPALNSITALSMLLLPSLSKNKKNLQQTRKTIITFLSFSVLISTVSYLLLYVFKTDILGFCYNDKYIHLYHLIPWIGILPFFASITCAMGSVLRALERPDKVFWAYLVSTIVTLSLGITFSIKMGIQGAIWGLLVSSLTTGVMMVVFSLPLISREI